VRGLFLLLPPFFRMQGMREGGPFLLSLRKEGIDQRNTLMEFHGGAPWCVCSVDQHHREEA